MTDAPLSWSLVIPVRGATGKTRLSVPGVDRQALSRAIALDTIEAAAACDSVGQLVVVTADRDIVASVPTGVTVIADPGTGLNGAVAAGIDHLGDCARTAVLLGDIPALDPNHLAEALAAAVAHLRIAVPDRERVGTTLLAQRDAGALHTSFGEGSLERHRASGFTVLDGFNTLHRDVDDAEQLRAALMHGTAPRTSAVLASATQTHAVAQGASLSVAHGASLSVAPGASSSVAQGASSSVA